MVSPVKKKRMDSSKQQESRNAAEDRISDLPDSLLHHILSFLKMRNVVVTSLLSRRWRYLWMSTPVLDFDKWGRWGPTPIGRALLLHEGTSIQKFRIRCNLRDYDRSHVGSWISYLVRLNVIKLDLDFAAEKPRDHGELYKLHHCLFTCGSLEVLRLRYCNLNLPTSVNLRLLKTIDLCLMKLTNVDIRVLTSGCPLLENMSMVECTNVTEFNIFAPNPNMKSLRIHRHNYDHEDGAGIEIFVPYVLSLELSGDFIRYYKSLNLPSIVNVSFDFERMLGFRYKDKDDHFAELLSGLSSAKTLKLCGRCVQVLAASELVDTSSPYFHATHLELKTGLGKNDHLGIAYLLRAAHHLESLVIYISTQKDLLSGNLHQMLSEHEFDTKEMWKSLEVSLSCQLSHLKTIMIFGFMGSKVFSYMEWSRVDVEKFIKRREHEVELVRFLLRNSKMLEKMIISTTKDEPFSGWALKSEVLLALTNELLVLPRASHDADIVLS